MAKIIKHDYSAIHEALNKMIVAEVKEAMELLPGKCLETNVHCASLCRIVVSDPGSYLPYDLGVRRVWIDEDGGLCFTEYEERYESPCVWTENDDLLDITDFGYLIDQIAEQVEGDASLNITDGLYVHRLSEAVSKTI